MKNVEKQFDTVANDYDKQRKSLIPYFDNFYGIAIENLVLKNEEPVLMDIGAGTGLFSAMVLRKYPLAHIELIDISNEMLQMSKQRLAAYLNVRTTKININDIHLANNQYDVVISSLAIHHLTDEEKKHISEDLSRTEEWRDIPPCRTSWLIEIGFRNVDCLYKYYDFVVMKAEK